MNTDSRGTPNSALTVIELLIVVAVLIILAAIMLPSLDHRPARGPRINCTNNLKQIGLAFGTWASDNGGQFPMKMSTNAGGTMELVNGPSVFVHFQSMSNELSTPKVLACPADRKRSSATNFASDLKNVKVSYFVGVDAVATNSQMFLSGDRNITNGLKIRGGILELTTNQLAGWTEELHGNCGNVGLADGSVQQFTDQRLRDALRWTGATTNRLAIP